MVQTHCRYRNAVQGRYVAARTCDTQENRVFFNVYIIDLITTYWHFLLITAISNALFAHLSYSPSINRDSWWFVPACLACAIGSNLSWAVFLRVAKSNAERFVVAQVWDLIPILFFCILPHYVYIMELSGWKLWAGIALIVVGTILVGYANKTVG